MSYTVTIKSGNDTATRVHSSLADALSHVVHMFGGLVSVTEIMRDCVQGIEHVSCIGDAYLFVLPTRH